MPRPRNTVVPNDAELYQPTRARPVRVRSRHLAADAHFEPHRHAWAQVAYSSTGILQVTAADREGAGDVTYLVPPSRAVWIAPSALHWVHVIEAAQFRTLYVHASVAPPEWEGSRVLVVSPLLRELVSALDEPGVARTREDLLTTLLLDELRGAATQPLGVPMPPTQTGDKRLRALCEAVLRAPSQHATLARWAAEVGASERTMARLFRDELGTSYQQWRQQAVLAHALPLLARGMPIGLVAAASGYASESAFTAMFRSAMGRPPRDFLRGAARP